MAIELVTLRASPLADANGNGNRPFLEGPGQLPGSGPAVGASGPGPDTANGTHGGLWRGI